MKKAMLLLVSAAVCGTACAAAEYDADSQPGDLIVTVGSGSETFDASKLTVGVTNILKKGDGTLVASDIGSYAGAITIEKGIYQYAKAVHLGASSGGAVHVLSGGTLECKQTDAQSAVGKTVYFEGPGVTDVYGALRFDGTTSPADTAVGPFGERLVMTDDATITDTLAPSAKARFANLTLDMQGHALTMNCHASGTYFIKSKVVNSGHIVVKTKSFGINQTSFDGTADNTLTVTGSSGLYVGSLSADKTTPWTIILDTTANLHQESSPTYWHGPVVFRKHIPYGAYSSNHKLFFDNKVSGPDGITVMGKDEFDKNGTRIRYNPTLELSYPGNTFEGGVAVNFGTLSLPVNGALPANGGKLSLTNSTVKLDATGKVKYELPELSCHGTGVVSVVGGYGKWKGTVVKENREDLVYDSHVRMDALDVRAGRVVKLPNAPNPQAGLYRGMQRYGSYNELYAAFQTRVTFTNETVLTPDRAFNCYTGKIAQPDTTEADWNGWTTNALYTYTGYLWNRTGTNVTWTFAMCTVDQVRMYVDGNEIFQHKSTSDVDVTNVFLTTGPHAVEIRMQNNDDKWAGARGTPGWANSHGIVVDRLGRGYRTEYDVTNDKTGAIEKHWTSNKDLFEQLIDPGDGSVFTTCLPDETPVIPFVPAEKDIFSIGAMSFAPGTGAGFVTRGASEFEIADLTGLPRLENAFMLAVTNRWTVSLPEATTNCLTTTGSLKFGADTTLRIENPEKFRPRGVTAAEYVIAETDEGVVGLPALEPVDNWALRRSDDGKKLLLEYTAPGLLLLIR